MDDKYLKTIERNVGKCCTCEKKMGEIDRNTAPQFIKDACGVYLEYSKIYFCKKCYMYSFVIDSDFC